jgi:hypothetical protein
MCNQPDAGQVLFGQGGSAAGPNNSRLTATAACSAALPVIDHQDVAMTTTVTGDCAYSRDEAAQSAALGAMSVTDALARDRGRCIAAVASHAQVTVRGVAATFLQGEGNAVDTLPYAYVSISL